MLVFNYARLANVSLPPEYEVRVFFRSTKIPHLSTPTFHSAWPRPLPWLAWPCTDPSKTLTPKKASRSIWTRSEKPLCKRLKTMPKSAATARLWPEPLSASLGTGEWRERSIGKWYAALVVFYLTHQNIFCSLKCSCGTYKEADNSGGSNGARMRFHPESGYGNNAVSDLLSIVV